MKSGLLSELSDFDEFSINHCKDIEDLLKENEELKADCEDLFNQKEMMFKNMQLNQLKVCELAKEVDLWNKKYNEEVDKNKELHNKINKAIEYIEENKYIDKEESFVKRIAYDIEEVEVVEIEDLLEILKDGDVDE